MDKRDEQSIDALKLYYQQNLSQAEVAARLGISRPTVAKLLAHGRDRGFVTISIHDPRDEASELAARLERCYGLSCVRVAHGHAMTEDEAIDQVGRVGADLVSQLVHDGMSVGISWGRTMSAVASYLTRSPRQGVCVVQLKGGTSFSARATHDFEVDARVLHGLHRAAALPAPSRHLSEYEDGIDRVQGPGDHEDLGRGP